MLNGIDYFLFKVWKESECSRWNVQGVRNRSDTRGRYQFFNRTHSVYWNLPQPKRPAQK